MVIESEKPIKICHFCQKEVRNMGFHIANQHPNILAQLDEYAGTGKIDISPSAPAPPSPQKFTNLNQMIQEKLDIMMNIKIIEMMSKSSDVSLKQISDELNPPKPTPISELKAYHDLIYNSEKEAPYVETENQWVNVIQQGLPIVKEMIGGMRKQKPQEDEKDVRTGEERNTNSLKPIQLEIAGDSREPSCHLQKPRVDGKTEQQDNRSDY